MSDETTVGQQQENENAQEQQKRTLEELLTDKDLREQYEKSVSGLKSALQKEREERSRLEAHLKRLLDMLGDEDIDALRAREREASARASELEEKLHMYLITLAIERAAHGKTPHPELVSRIARDEFLSELKFDENGQVANATEVVERILTKYDALRTPRLGTPNLRDARFGGTNGGEHVPVKIRF